MTHEHIFPLLRPDPLRPLEEVFRADHISRIALLTLTSAGFVAEHTLLQKLLPGYFPKTMNEVHRLAKITVGSYQGKKLLIPTEDHTVPSFSASDDDITYLPLTMATNYVLHNKQFDLHSLALVYGLTDISNPDLLFNLLKVENGQVQMPIVPEFADVHTRIGSFLNTIFDFNEFMPQDRAETPDYREIMESTRVKAQRLKFPSALIDMIFRSPENFFAVGSARIYRYPTLVESLKDDVPPKRIKGLYSLPEIVADLKIEEPQKEPLQKDAKPKRKTSDEPPAPIVYTITAEPPKGPSQTQSRRQKERHGDIAPTVNELYGAAAEIAADVIAHMGALDGSTLTPEQGELLSYAQIIKGRSKNFSLPEGTTARAVEQIIGGKITQDSVLELLAELPDLPEEIVYFLSLLENR